MQYQKDLHTIINAVKIVSTDMFSFAGKTFTTNANISYQQADTAIVNPLVRLLGDVIYQQCYCRKFSGTYHESPPAAKDDGTFQQRLSQANTTITRWDNGWVVEQVLSTGQYVVNKNNKYKLVYPGEFITEQYQPALPQPGAKIVVHLPKESLGLQPSFYFAYSNEIHDQKGLVTLVRFYWNIKSTGAARLIELLTRELNKYSIPFLFKCVNDPSFFNRNDAAVLYLSKHYYHITAQILMGVYEQIKGELNAETPGFTKKLIAGLGLAEDPANGQSFGMSRCGIIAQGIYNAHQSGSLSTEEIISHVQKAFEAIGIQINTPYLNAGSTDIYQFAG